MLRIARLNWHCVLSDYLADIWELEIPKSSFISKVDVLVLIVVYRWCGMMMVLNDGNDNSGDIPMMVVKGRCRIWFRWWWQKWW